MRTIVKMIAIAIVVCIGLGANAQNHAKEQSKALLTATIKVNGNCSSCKTRIEKAAHVAGAKKAEWNESTKDLTVVFDPTKTSVDAIEKKIASVGHDNEKYQTDDKTYNALPGCCKYR